MHESSLIEQVETFTRKYGLLVILGLMALEIGVAWRRGEL